MAHGRTASSSRDAAITPMERSMKVTGLMESHMARASKLGRTGANTMACGIWGNQLVEEEKSILTAGQRKDTGKMAALLKEVTSA